MAELILPGGTVLDKDERLLVASNVVAFGYGFLFCAVTSNAKKEIGRLYIVAEWDDKPVVAIDMVKELTPIIVPEAYSKILPIQSAFMDKCYRVKAHFISHYFVVGESTPRNLAHSHFTRSGVLNIDTGLTFFERKGEKTIDPCAQDDESIRKLVEEFIENV